MTEIKTILPLTSQHQLEIELIGEDRKLFFKKECLEYVTIYRKVNDDNWLQIVKNARAPFVDSETFIKPVHIEYKVVFEDDNRGNESNTVKIQLPL
ncbi:hypothetical protein [Chryseosolibacter indicus]|uniref:Uncharacterized protein n=1 Tax=Chryseosolibacter indicus TaxID=2782351 RepID=A0ABS5VL20_9BACT|nr:hypothetical protein [Chryseosolibacter indicus]MBT1701801.1 hypothetical protein [Chryseosolibacter indicus]